LETAPATYAEAQLGAAGMFLKLHFRHTAYVILDARSGRIEVHAKAEALWALGLEEWGGRWLGWLSYASGSVPCSVRTARSSERRARGSRDRLIVERAALRDLPSGEFAKILRPRFVGAAFRACADHRPTVRMSTVLVAIIAKSSETLRS
jgi:hypothetical protein